MIRQVCPCGVIASEGTRCPRHRVNKKGFRVDRHRTSNHSSRAVTEMNARVVAEWRAKHGDWCPGYGVPAHASRDLTAQHPVRITDGGSALGQQLTVLCVTCNSRHSLEMQNAKRAGVLA